MMLSFPELHTFCTRFCDLDLMWDSHKGNIERERQTESWMCLLTSELICFHFLCDHYMCWQDLAYTDFHGFLMCSELNIWCTYSVQPIMVKSVDCLWEILEICVIVTSMELYTYMLLAFVTFFYFRVHNNFGEVKIDVVSEEVLM